MNEHRVMIKSTSVTSSPNPEADCSADTELAYAVCEGDDQRLASEYD